MVPLQVGNEKVFLLSEWSKLSSAANITTAMRKSETKSPPFDKETMSEKTRSLYFLFSNVYVS